MTFESQYFDVNGITLHAKIAGPSMARTVVMLHGFPEYWAAWAPVAAFLEDEFRLILPDQRGFNLSSKPAGERAYDTKHMVTDLCELIQQVNPDSPVVLCGHDWGASVAYAYAMRHPKDVSHLIIANGVHPVCFQKALYAGGAQTDASQYMNVLRAEGSEARLSRENFQPLLNMFENFSAAPWLDATTKEAYRQAWKNQDALSSMLNWYRASPMVVPQSGTPGKDLPINSEMLEKYHIAI